MKKFIFLTMLLTSSLLIFACGGSDDSSSGDVSSDVVFVQVEDSEKIYTIDDFINILRPEINSEINFTIIGGGIQIKERKEDICSWINSKENNLIIFTSAKYIDLSFSINSIFVFFSISFFSSFLT